MKKDSLQRIAHEVRGVAMDAVAKAQSGHLGLPLGCAELASVLFGEFLRYNPSNPRWLNRDRFILSAGHGSILLYTFLHLMGYPLTLEDLKQFRQLGSQTPGHPEFGHTLGVEATTGPLGQGIGNAVGIALSQKKAAATFNTDQHKIFDNHVVCLCGEGCLQEGVGQESIALAGHWGLDNLILIYDANLITLDAPLSASQTEDVCAKFEAMGWSVQNNVDGHNFEAIEAAYQWAQQRDGRPHLIVARTCIGKGIPGIEGTHKAHGPNGFKLQKEAKQNWGLDPEKTFYISEETYQYFQKRRQVLQKEYQQWLQTFEAWQQENPDLAEKLSQTIDWPDSFFDALPTSSHKPMATRTIAGELLNAVARRDERWLGGSADLFDSIKNFIKDGDVFQKNNPLGRNLEFGIREHAMGAICNGIAYDKLFTPSGSTFLSFSDYLKPSIRVAALAKLPVYYFFSHDSLAVGEDGPTHQPIEQVASFQLMPNVQVYRPADYDETLACFQVALQEAEGPQIFILSRQDLPHLDSLEASKKRAGTRRGAYILKQEEGILEYLIIASGSEVSLALETARLLGPKARVVSIPSRTRFLQQEPSYQNEILPPSCERRIFIEMGCTHLNRAFVGFNGLTIGIDRFGTSGPQLAVFEHFGFTPQVCHQRILEHSWE